MIHRASLIALLILGAGLPAGGGLPPVFADKQAPAEVPAIWNGVKSAPAVKEKLKAYFDADDAERTEIRAFLDSLGTLKPRDVSRFTKSLCKEMTKHGPRIGHKSGFTFTHGSLSGEVHTAGKPKRRHPLLIARLAKNPSMAGSP